MNDFFDRSWRVVSDLPKIGAGATLAGVIVTILTFGVTFSIDQLYRPDLTLYQTALRTMPLTLAVCSVVIAASKRWFEKPLSYVVFAMLAIGLSSGIADYASCHPDCGGTTQIQKANQRVNDWTPESLKGIPLVGVFPFLVAIVLEYLWLYSLGTFLSAFVCGWFLALAVMRLWKKFTENEI
jgi:hypothetical protein